MDSKESNNQIIFHLRCICVIHGPKCQPNRLVEYQFQANMELLFFTCIKTSTKVGMHCSTFSDTELCDENGMNIMKDYIN